MSKKGENIFKRKDGRWEARYIRARDETGKAIYGYCYGSTYNEAKQKVTALRRESKPKNEKKRQRGKTTVQFSTLCADWLSMRRLEIKESTFIKYQQIIREHILPWLGSYSLQKITTYTVEDFKLFLLAKKGLSPNTVKTVLIVLKSILAHGAQQFPDIMNKVDVRYPKVGGSSPRVLTEDEQTHLVGYLLRDADPCKYGILLALLTGMRLGELCALKWENISLEQKAIRVTASIQRLRDLDENAEDRTHLFTDTPKSQSSIRVIPLSDEAVRLCRKIRMRRNSAYFLTGSQKPMEPRTLQYRLEKYAHACGLAGVHFHTLRHTFATRCVESGFEIKSLSEVLGHASTRITLDRYVHSSMALKRANMEKIVLLDA